MSPRQHRSGRLPAFGQLSDLQRTEIARLFQDERPYAIAIRLGVPKRLVKAEVRRLRQAARLERRASITWATAAARALVPLAASGAFFAMAMNARSSRTTPDAHLVTLDHEPDAARALYERIDSHTLRVADAAARLEDADERVRLAAIRGYVQASPATHDPGPLVARLNDPEERVRLAALQALGTMGEPGAVPALTAVLGSPRSAAERALALDALSQTPDDSSVPPQIAALADAAGPIRARAFAALSRRFGSTLDCTVERLESEPGAVRDVFEHFWKERGR